MKFPFIIKYTQAQIKYIGKQMFPKEPYYSIITTKRKAIIERLKAEENRRLKIRIKRNKNKKIIEYKENFFLFLLQEKRKMYKYKDKNKIIYIKITYEVEYPYNGYYSNFPRKYKKRVAFYTLQQEGFKEFFYVPLERLPHPNSYKKTIAQAIEVYKKYKELKKYLQKSLFLKLVKQKSIPFMYGSTSNIYAIHKKTNIMINITYYSTPAAIKYEIIRKKREQLLKDRALYAIANAEKIFVSLRDSIKAGNCFSGTMQFIHAHFGPFFKRPGVRIRGSFLLLCEDTQYIRNAITMASLKYL